MDKTIDIEFLGVGSAFSKRFGNNSAIVTVNNNGTVKRLMIDCGRTTPDDMQDSAYSWQDIDAIFITHLHGDHVYGLEEAGFYGRYVLNKKPHLIFPHKKIKVDLWDKVLKGTMMNGDLDRNMVLEDYFTYDIVDEVSQYFMFNDVMFSVFTTQHIPNKKSYGLIIGEYDYIVYTSDSLFDHAFIDAVIQGGAQVVFHDCQFEDNPNKVHASLSELLTLPEEDRRKVVIMHFGDNLDSNYWKVLNSGMRVASRYQNYRFTVK